MKAPFRRSALYASILATGAQVALAQPQLEEIIVTARKRVESLQDVPISVSAVSGSKMEQAGITNLEKLTAYVPNFSMNQTGISSTITVRGISSGINQSFEQSVGMYNDGIYFGKAQLSRLPLFDMERIEVLRGPQPILFGKNSIAGAVSLITAKPSDEFEGSVQALYEPDANEQDYRFVVTGPITDTLSGRLSVLYREMDGWIENVAAGNRDEKQEDETVVRVGALWKATDDLSVQLKYENSRFNTTGRNIEIVDDITLETNPPGARSYLTGLTGLVGTLNTLINLGARTGPLITDYVVDDAEQNQKRSAGAFDTSDNDVDSFMMNADYSLGESTLTFLTGYVQYTADESCDCDYTSAPIIDGSILQEDYDQFSQEIRLTSPGGETVDYIAGLFYQENSLDYSDIINIPANSLLRILSNSFAGVSTRRTFEQDTEVWAAFAQATWNINEAWRLVLGGRYTQEDKSGSRVQANFDNTGSEVLPSDPRYAAFNGMFGALRVEPNNMKGKLNEDAFTPLVTLQWDATDDIMLYATYVEGFKSAGYDNRSNAHPDPAVVVPGTPANAVGAWEFDKEEATNYEIGMKSSIGGVAELNIAAFYTEYDDLQTSVFDGGVGFNVANAAGAEISGVEIDGRWAIAEYFTLSGSLGYLDFEFKDFDVAQCWFGQTVLEPDSVTNAALQQCDASGKRKEYTPEWKGVLTGEFHYPLSDALELRAVVDVQYSDEYLWTPQLDPRALQDAYTKVNARIALAQAEDSWEIAVVGNNLTDEETIDYGGTGVLASTATGGTGNAYYAFSSRPRYYAIQGIYRF
ncbi:MAG: TonB-dependent receptor [Gammaproteobacteria bacterium]|nr:TonB-dependent receptor [Gammaproteobacteria bacterium]